MSAWDTLTETAIAGASLSSQDCSAVQVRSHNESRACLVSETASNRDKPQLRLEAHLGVVLH